MELKQIGYFVRVAELGSFSRAALSLNTAQSALSRQVKKLEEELGVQLLYRNGRGVILTPAGALLLERGRAAVETLEHVAAEIAGMSAMPRGNAVIGVPPTVGRLFTVPFTRRFRQEFPQASLRVVESFSGNLLEWLFAGRIDVAILFDDPSTPTAIFEPVVEEDLAWIVPPGAPEASEGPTARLVDVLARPLVLPGRPHGLREYLQRVADEAGLPLRIAFEVDALHSMLEAVREGIGHSILPHMAVRREIEQGHLRALTIVEPQLTRLVYVATAGQRAGAVPNQQIARLVRAQLLELTPAASWRVPRRDAEAAAFPASARAQAPAA